MKARNRSGAKPIKIDHVIPLSQRSIEILELLEAQQKRDKIDTEYAFSNYMTANMSGADIGNPTSYETTRRLLARLLARLNENRPLSLGAVEGTMHGMRTCFRSWLADQRIDGHPRFAEIDMERAIAHVSGYGQTQVSRLYSRQSKDIEPLIEEFASWEEYVTKPSGTVLPFHMPFTDKQTVRPHPTKAYPEALAKNRARFTKMRTAHKAKTKT
jgi:hypothetical protein